MKTKILLISFLFFYSSKSFSQNVFKTYFDDIKEYAWVTDLEETENKYIIACNGFDIDNIPSAYTVIFSKSGKLERIIKPEIHSERVVFSNIILADSSIIFVGQSGNDYKADIFICEYDSLFNLKREKHFLTPKDTVIGNVKFCKLPNDNIVLAGSTSIYPSDMNTYYNLFQYKLSSSLDSISSYFDKTQGKRDFFSDIIYFPVKNELLISFYKLLSNDLHPFINETDTEFNLMNEIKIESGNPYDDYNTKSNMKLFNDSLFLFQTIKDREGGTKDITLLLFDKEFDILKETVIYTPTNKEDCLSKGLDFFNKSNIYVAGKTLFSTNNLFILANLDSLLNIKWQKFIYTNENNGFVPNVIKATSDGGCLISGLETTSNNVINFILKVDSLGNIPTSIKNSTIQVKELIIYPNPSKSSLNIRTTVQRIGGEFKMYDISGIQVLQQKITESVTQINTNNLPTGAYIYKYIHKNKVIESGKWIKE